MSLKLLYQLLSHHERVLIIDDVLTTGSTVSACAAAMKRSGTKFVAVLTAGTPYFHGLDSQGKT
jgi:predicted amidophosphoribosyltransferase